MRRNDRMNRRKFEKPHSIPFFTQKVYFELNSRGEVYSTYFPTEQTKKLQSDCNDRLTSGQSD